QQRVTAAAVRRDHQGDSVAMHERLLSVQGEETSRFPRMEWYNLKPLIFPRVFNSYSATKLLSTLCKNRSARPLPRTGLWPTQRLVKERAEADAGLREAPGDRGQMLCQIRFIHGHDLLLFVPVEGLVCRLVPTAGRGRHTIADGRRGRDRKRLVGPDRGAC